MFVANCEDRDVKLRGTAGSEKEGLVLVCINKRWGPICQINNEAITKTLCRQLGYTNRDGKKLFMLAYHGSVILKHNIHLTLLSW